MFFAALELAADSWKAKLKPQVDVVALLQARLRGLPDSDSDSPLPSPKARPRRADNRLQYKHCERCESRSARTNFPKSILPGEGRVRHKSTPLTKLPLPPSSTP